MKTELWNKIQSSPLYLDQTSHVLEIEREELALYYEPLANEILARCLPGQRQIVALVGPPGCGKTAFAAILSLVINAIAGESVAISVGMDGWHFPNKYLDTHLVQKEDGQIPLRQVKGAAESFDTEAIGAFLGQVSRASTLTFPVYSREIHDPVAGIGAINEAHCVVIIEGNYWLLDELPWKTFQKYFDLKLFISAKPEDLITGLRERHLRGGKTPEWVAEHIRRVDIPNMERVLEHSIPADAVIHKKDSRKITGLVWRDGFLHEVNGH